MAPSLLITEVASAIARRTDAARGDLAVKAVMGLSSLRLQQITPKLALEAAQLAIVLRLKGADALYVALAARLRISLISWDGELLRRASSRIAVYEPTV